MIPWHLVAESTTPDRCQSWQHVQDLFLDTPLYLFSVMPYTVSVHDGKMGRVVTACTSCFLRFRNAAFYLQIVFMCFILFLTLGAGIKCPV